MVATIHPSAGDFGIEEARIASCPLRKKLIDLVEVGLLGVRRDHDHEHKLRWLASQIIGADAELVSPFGHRRITYCDHTASGRFLRFIEEYLVKDVLPFYGNTHTVDNYLGLHMTDMVKQSTNYIKTCTKAGPNDALLFCGSGSTAAIKRLQEIMGIAVPPSQRGRLLDSLLPSERWVVFLGPYEHHSNLLSWRQSLAEVHEIGLDDNGKFNLLALEAALKSPEFAGRPKLGSFSACSNVTGVHTDTRKVASLLHRHGAYACFDFACSGPYADIDMRRGKEDGYDAIFVSPHKFLGGPGSPGILLMNDSLYLLNGGPPSTSGGGTVLYVNGYDEEETLYSEHLEEREDAGTPPIVQKLRATFAFAVKSYVGHELIQRRELEIRQHAVARLSVTSRVRILGEENQENQPIFSFIVYPDVSGSKGKHLHCHFTSRLLNDLFGIQARGGCACAGPYTHLLLGVSREHSLAYRAAIEKGFEGLKPGFTRVSFAYYTMTEEMDFVLDAIEFVAEHGYKFLPLYKFDWKTGAWDFCGDDDIILPSVGSFKAAVRRCREMGERAIRRCRPLLEIGRSHVEVAPPAYHKYLRSALEIAAALPVNPISKQPFPEGVEAELVDFMI